MGNLSALLKRGYLEKLWRDAKAAGVQLFNALTAFQDVRYEDIWSGNAVTSTSQGGNSVSFRLPTPSVPMTPEAVAELSQEFIQAYRNAVSTLPAGSSDDAIFSQMMDDDAFFATTSYRPDFSFPCRY